MIRRKTFVAGLLESADFNPWNMSGGNSKLTYFLKTLRLKVTKETQINLFYLFN